MAVRTWAQEKSYFKSRKFKCFCENSGENFLFEITDKQAELYIDVNGEIDINRKQIKINICLFCLLAEFLQSPYSHLLSDWKVCFNSVLSEYEEFPTSQHDPQAPNGQ